MASIIAAETSAATFLGVPGEGYTTKSFAYVQIIVGLILGRVVVGHVFLKPYYTFKVYTVYDYLGVRFGPWTKAYVSALFLFMRTLASGTRLFIPSLVMVLAYRLFVGGAQPQFGQEGVTTAGPYLVAIIALTVVTCLYTAVGGIKAVIWTDVVQTLIYVGGTLVGLVTILHLVPGELRRGQLEVDHGIGELGNAVLIGRYTGLKLLCQGLSHPHGAVPHLPAPPAVGLTGGLELGGLLVGEAQLLLHPGREPLLDSVP